MQPGGYYPATPFVDHATNNVKVITNYYTWATFINEGGATGIVTLKPGQSLSMPYLGRPYGLTTIDGTGTDIQIIYVR